MKKTKKLKIIGLFFTPVIVMSFLFAIIFTYADETRIYTEEQKQEQKQKEEQIKEVIRKLYEREFCDNSLVGVTNDDTITCETQLYVFANGTFTDCFLDDFKNNHCILNVSIAEEIPPLKKYFDEAYDLLDPRLEYNEIKIIFGYSGEKILSFYANDNFRLLFEDNNPDDDVLFNPNPQEPEPEIIDTCPEGIRLSFGTTDMCSNYLTPDLYEKLTRHSQMKWDEFYKQIPGHMFETLQINDTIDVKLDTTNRTMTPINYKLELTDDLIIQDDLE